MKKHLLIPDAHYPKQDKRKIKILFDVLEWWQPDAITILGDWYDAEGISRWKAGRKEEYLDGMAATMAPARDALYDLRNLAGDECDIHLRLGNHDLRVEDYIEKNAQGFADLPELTYRSLFHLDKLKISSSKYGDIPTKRLGKPSSNSGAFYVTHGHAVSKHSGQSAMKEMETYGVSGFSAHTHRLGMYVKTDMSGTKQWYECGHLADEKQMHYMPSFNWQHGFAIAYEHRGNVFPTLIPFVGNVCVVEGRKFN